MKKMLFLLMMLFTAVGVSAQEYYSAAVIAKLVLGGSKETNPDMYYPIRAYVGDEAEFRYEAYPEWIYPEYNDETEAGTAVEGFQGYWFRIPSNPEGLGGESDAGKTIRFELYDPQTGLCYPLSKTLTFPAGDETFGSATDPILFEITLPNQEDYAINLPEAEKGASYKLSDLLSYTKGATLPSNAVWKLGTKGMSADGGSYEFQESEIDGVSIKDGVLYTNEVAYRVTLWYGVPGEESPTAYTPETQLATVTFDVVLHATNIALNVTKLDIENTEYGRHVLDTLMWGQSYTILPEGTTDAARMRWEVENTNTEVTPLISWSANGFSFNRQDEGGLVRVRPYFSYDNSTKGETVTIYPKDASGNDLWVTINVTVPVQELEVDYNLYAGEQYNFTANVFDQNIYDRLAAMVTVKPTTATNTKFNFEYDGDVLKVEDGKITALKAGTGVITIRTEGKTAKTGGEAAGDTVGDGSETTEVEGEQLTAEITFSIENPVTDVTFDNAAKSLTIKLTDNAEENITDRVWGFFKPNGDPSVNATSGEYGIVKVEGSSAEIRRNDNDSAFWATQVGKTTFRVVMKWNDWAGYKGEAGAAAYVGPQQKTNTADFVVDVTNELTLQSLYATYTEAVAGKEITVTLTPYPEEATFNPEDIELSFALYVDPLTRRQNSELAAAYDKWSKKVITNGGRVSTSTAKTIVWKFTSEIPGIVAIQGAPVSIYQQDNSQTPNPLINVGYDLTLDEGWQWRSNPCGTVTTDKIQDVFGKKALKEIRTNNYLLFNEENFGMYGSLLNDEMGLGLYQCYKVNMNAAHSAVLYGDATSDIQNLPDNVIYSNGVVTLTLNAGWNWIGCPYLFNRDLNTIMALASQATQATIPAGTTIVGKQGFTELTAEYKAGAASASAASQGTWDGPLKYLEAGQGYLVYNPSETVRLSFPIELMMEPEDEGTNVASGNSVKGYGFGGRFWNYDHSRFMNNMAMVAVLDGIENPEDYSVGAFVGDECRGESFVENGSIFLTVHCDADEYVKFKLYNTLTGETEDIKEGVRAQMRVGSINSPILLHATTTGIRGIDGSEVDVEAYDLTGRRTTTTQRGISIRRLSDGSVRKVVVK